MSLQRIFLGLTVNSVSMEFEIPDEKLEKFFLLLDRVKLAGVMPVRLLASFLGLLNPFLVKRKIKLEDLRVVPDLVSEGDFMSTADL